MSGILAIAEALKANNRLTSLSLSGNDIDTAAGKTLADALLTNSALIRLDLSSNRLCGVWFDGRLSRQMGSHNVTAIEALGVALQVREMPRSEPDSRDRKLRAQVAGTALSTASP